MDLNLKGPDNAVWEDLEEGVKRTAPAWSVANLSMHGVYIPKGASHTLEDHEADAVSVTLLRGKLDLELLPMQAALQEQGNQITAEEDSLVFLVYRKGDYQTTFNPDLSGMSMHWDKKNEGIYRSEPLLWMDNISVNLWQARAAEIPEHDGKFHMGIHDHEPDPSHHHQAENMVEVHVQVAGSGNMVIYGSNDPNDVAFRHEMKFGIAHPLFCRKKDGRPQYPLHAYELNGDTQLHNALFLAFEDYNAVIPECTQLAQIEKYFS